MAEQRSVGFVRKVQEVEGRQRTTKVEFGVDSGVGIGNGMASERGR